MAKVAIPMGAASSRYASLTSDREPYLMRARNMASLTIPYLFRNMGANGGDHEELAWDSLGAYCVSNLASKVGSALYPVGWPAMKLAPSKEALAALTQMDDPDQRAGLMEAIQSGLSKVEQEFTACFEEDGDRARITMGTAKQIVGGTHGYQFYPGGTIRGLSLERFVCLRDPSGNLLEFALEDPLAWESLPAEIKAYCVAYGYEEPEVGQQGSSVCVYTHGFLGTKAPWTDPVWTVYQEVYGAEVPGTRIVYEPDYLPFLFAPWILLEGEHYGRSYAEQYEADLTTLEGLTQTISEGSAAMARMLTLVHPGGLTNRKAVAEAANGAVLSGRADDVTTVKTDKAGDFQVAAAQADKKETRLSRAFLLNSSIQRSGERVTAEEIRTMYAELEEALGGVYSQQIITQQMPYIRLKLHFLQQVKRVTPLPKGSTKVTILGGLAALGRNAEFGKLNQWLGAGIQVFGPQFVAALGPSAVREYARRTADALGINKDGLVPTEEQAQAAQQQQMQQQLAQQVAPEAVKQLGNNLTSNQVANTNADAKVAVASQPPAQPQQGA